MTGRRLTGFWMLGAAVLSCSCSLRAQAPLTPDPADIELAATLPPGAVGSYEWKPLALPEGASVVRGMQTAGGAWLTLLDGTRIQSDPDGWVNLLKAAPSSTLYDQALANPLAGPWALLSVAGLPDTLIPLPFRHPSPATAPLVAVRIFPHLQLLGSEGPAVLFAVGVNLLGQPVHPAAVRWGDTPGLEPLAGDPAVVLVWPSDEALSHGRVVAEAHVQGALGDLEDQAQVVARANPPPPLTGVALNASGAPVDGALVVGNVPHLGPQLIGELTAARADAHGTFHLPWWGSEVTPSLSLLVPPSSQWVLGAWDGQRLTPTTQPAPLDPWPPVDRYLRGTWWALRDAVYYPIYDPASGLLKFLQNLNTEPQGTQITVNQGLFQGWMARWSPSATPGVNFVTFQTRDAVQQFQISAQGVTSFSFTYRVQGVLSAQGSWQWGLHPQDRPFQYQTLPVFGVGSVLWYPPPPAAQAPWRAVTFGVVMDLVDSTSFDSLFTNGSSVTLLETWTDPSTGKLLGTLSSLRACTGVPLGTLPPDASYIYVGAYTLNVSLPGQARTGSGVSISGQINSDPSRSGSFSLIDLDTPGAEGTVLNVQVPSYFLNVPAALSLTDASGSLLGIGTLAPPGSASFTDAEGLSMTTQF